MARLTVAALVAALNGCGHVPTPGRIFEMPCQQGAELVVWTDVYGRTDKPPAVRWVLEHEQDCVDPTSGRGAFWFPGAGCHEGLTLSPYEVTVSWHDGDTYDFSAFAHELLHAAQWRQGIWDPQHVRPEWDLVPAAKEALASSDICSMEAAP
jgi:hypothetical protein